MGGTTRLCLCSPPILGSKSSYFLYLTVVISTPYRAKHLQLLDDTSENKPALLNPTSSSRFTSFRPDYISRRMGPLSFTNGIALLASISSAPKTSPLPLRLRRRRPANNYSSSVHGLGQIFILVEEDHLESCRVEYLKVSTPRYFLVDFE